MPPTLILIRHAQGQHNATEDYGLRDPLLTPLGRDQCKELSLHLQNNVPLAGKIELIVTSPLRRTLQTTQLGLDWLVKRGVPVQTRAEWQENSDMPCDIGSSHTELMDEFPQFTYDTIDPDEFPAKSGRFAFTEEAVIRRGIECRQWLRKRHESVIAVVTHSAFLRVGIYPNRWANADFRIFDFRTDSDALEQWDLTEVNGGGMGRSPKGMFITVSADFRSSNSLKNKKQDGESQNTQAMDN